MATRGSHDPTYPMSDGIDGTWFSDSDGENGPSASEQDADAGEASGSSSNAPAPREFLPGASSAGRPFSPNTSQNLAPLLRPLSTRLLSPSVSSVRKRTSPGGSSSGDVPIADVLARADEPIAHLLVPARSGGGVSPPGQTLGTCFDLFVFPRVSSPPPLPSRASV